jgi:predicted flap endonuclease-1-like 5' DNA nuclease
MSVREQDEWTQDSAWYGFEPKLKELSIRIGKGTRKYVKTLIRELCREAGVTRESLGIIAAPRCTMYFDGQWTSVTFEKIEELAGMGTDIVFIEKLDIVRVLGKYASAYGVALVNSQGHLAEYGKDLIEAANASGANLGIFTDDDKHGHMIADEAPGEIVRLGVDDAMYQHFGLTPGGNNTKIDGVLAAVGGEALWEYLMERLEEEYPTRDYTRVIEKPDLSKHDPEAIKNIRDIIYKYRDSITAHEWAEIESKLTEVNGFINVDEKRDEIDEELGKIVEADELLKELASKLADVKPILDKIENALRAKEDEKRKKEQEEKERIEREKAELAKRKQQEEERQEKEKAELLKRYGEICSKYNLEIQDIADIGPTTARKLKEAGIVSPVELATANVNDLAIDFNYGRSPPPNEIKERVASMIAAAKKLIDEKIVGGEEDGGSNNNNNRTNSQN